MSHPCSAADRPTSCRPRGRIHAAAADAPRSFGPPCPKALGDKNAYRHITKRTHPRHRRRRLTPPRGRCRHDGRGRYATLRREVKSENAERHADVPCAFPTDAPRRPNGLTARLRVARGFVWEPDETKRQASRLARSAQIPKINAAERSGAGPTSAVPLSARIHARRPGRARSPAGTDGQRRTPRHPCRGSYGPAPPLAASVRYTPTPRRPISTFSHNHGPEGYFYRLHSQQS